MIKQCYLNIFYVLAYILRLINNSQLQVHTTFILHNKVQYHYKLDHNWDLSKELFMHLKYLIHNF